MPSSTQNTPPDDAPENIPTPHRAHLVIRLRNIALKMYKGSLLWMAYLAVIQMALSAMLIMIYFVMNLHLSTEVQSSVHAGQVQAAGMHDQSSHGWVQTNIGIYFVKSPMSARFAESLTLERRQDGSRYLCDSTANCTKLL